MKIDAQILIDTCDTQEFNPKQFRKEINISRLINDAVKQFKEMENGK